MRRGRWLGLKEARGGDAKRSRREQQNPAAALVSTRVSGSKGKENIF